MPNHHPKPSGAFPLHVTDDKKEASVASMIFNGASCWGEEGASPSLLKDMGFGTEMMEVDQRWSYIETANPGLKNGVIIYYISKYSGQDDLPTLSSPVMLRLSEVYLNRAEANANLGNAEEALNDLNEIRTNRMIVPDGGDLNDYLLMLPEIDHL